MLPKHMAPRHIEYSKLKELEKQQVQDGLSDLLLKQVIRPSCEGALPVPSHEGGSTLISKEDSKRNPNEQALLSFPSSLHLVIPIRLITFPTTSPSSSNLVCNYSG